MKTLYSYKSVPDDAKGSVLAIGNYDGVHRGHQIILNTVRKIAAEKKQNSGILYFDPHPREFFLPDQPHFYLSTPTRKLKLLEHFGLDLAVVLPFNKELASLSAEEFVAGILAKGLGISHVVVGYNFYYGKNRTGTPQSLIDFGRQYGFEATIIPEQKDESTVFSSTLIRNYLREGNVRKAAELLGYWWRVDGKVVTGAQIGTGLGFPTANIRMLPGQDLKAGIYAVNTYIDGKRHKGAAYYGSRPTFDNGDTALEVFLLDFNDDLYGKTLEVEFIDFIRDDKKFESVDDLTKSMKQDVEIAKQVLSNYVAGSSDIAAI